MPSLRNINKTRFALLGVILFMIPIIIYSSRSSTDEEMINYSIKIINKEEKIYRLISQADSIWNLFSEMNIKSIFIETSKKNNLVHYTIRDLAGKSDTSFNLIEEPYLIEITSPYILSKYLYTRDYFLFYRIGSGRNKSTYSMVLILNAKVEDKEMFIESKFKDVVSIKKIERD
jgi:hypothetical protein